MKAAPEQVPVRTLIRWFGYERRSKYIVSRIRNKMDALEIRTVPAFEFVYIDTRVRFELLSKENGSSKSSEGTDDPTVRIGALAAANKPPIYVKPDEPLSVATTLMRMKDFSQLPVMTNPGSVKGVISWESIGSRLTLGQECRIVRQCMEAAREVRDDTPLFEAILGIYERGYVLVKSIDGSVTGIVTASDVAHQFMQLAGPFLAIGEIEGHLRRLLYHKFTLDELRQASLDQDNGNGVDGLADMTFGDYVQLLQKPDNWERLGLLVDRRVFTDHLDRVREIRNDVMHFDPDGLDPEDEAKIQDLTKFFRGLVRMGAI